MWNILPTQAVTATTSPIFQKNVYHLGRKLVYVFIVVSINWIACHAHGLGARLLERPPLLFLNRSCHANFNLREIMLLIALLVRGSVCASSYPYS